MLPVFQVTPEQVHRLGMALFGSLAIQRQCLRLVFNNATASSQEVGVVVLPPTNPACAARRYSVLRRLHRQRSPSHARGNARSYCAPSGARPARQSGTSAAPMLHRVRCRALSSRILPSRARHQTTPALAAIRMAQRRAPGSHRACLRNCSTLSTSSRRNKSPCSDLDPAAQQVVVGAGELDRGGRHVARVSCWIAPSISNSKVRWPPRAPGFGSRRMRVQRATGHRVDFVQAGAGVQHHERRG